MKSIRVFSLALLATVFTSLAVFAAGDPNGTWKFKAEGPNGRSVEATVALKWDNNQLSGTVDNRTGKVPIANAKFADDQVTFSVTRKIRRRSFTTNYNGKLVGDTIKGTIQATGRDEQPVTIPWEAQRVKP